MLHDLRGNAITGADARSLAAFETALAQFNCYVGDPVATLDGALADSPDFAMARILKAYLLLSAMEGQLVPVAQDVAAPLADLTLNDRERAHAGAVASLAAGAFHDASRRLDAILVDNPRDMVALQVGHLLDFFRGDARNLRDRVARVAPEWSEDLPGYHAVLSMTAFGLEETGAYAAAEAAGRRSVALNPRDGWGYHAVAHVMEMQGRTAEGVDWLADQADTWSAESFFAVHNWWHLALFRLEQDDIAGVLALYDAGIRGGQSAVTVDLLDATAMLWRLRLRGIDVGARWQKLADTWATRIDDRLYAFNDVHAVMAFLGAGRRAEAAAVLANLRAVAAIPTANGTMAADVGLPLAQALVEFEAGRHSAAADALLALRGIAHRFGGSHAQRDLLDLTLIEAAQRQGNRPLVAALANERLHAKPESPLARRYRAAARQPAAAVA